MKLVYRRGPWTEAIPPINAVGSVGVHWIYWPIDNAPHIGVLLLADEITLSDGTRGCALLIDLKRRRGDTPRTVVALSLFAGDLQYVHTSVSLLFRLEPSIEHMFDVDGTALMNLHTLLTDIDDVEFSLIPENGVTCVSLVNDIKSHYSTMRSRFELQLHPSSTEKCPKYDIVESI